MHLDPYGAQRGSPEEIHDPDQVNREIGDFAHRVRERSLCSSAHVEKSAMVGFEHDLAL